MSHSIGKLPTQSAETLQQIITALTGLEYGSVEITLHQGRIVQIERRERMRFDNKRHPALTTTLDRD